jgi:hypothetical protein
VAVVPYAVPRNRTRPAILALNKLRLSFSWITLHCRVSSNALRGREMSDILSKGNSNEIQQEPVRVEARPNRQAELPGRPEKDRGAKEDTGEQKRTQDTARSYTAELNRSLRARRCVERNQGPGRLSRRFLRWEPIEEFLGLANEEPARVVHAQCNHGRSASAMTRKVQLCEVKLGTKKGRYTVLFPVRRPADWLKWVAFSAGRQSDFSAIHGRKRLARRIQDSPQSFHEACGLSLRG